MAVGALTSSIVNLIAAREASSVQLAVAAKLLRSEGRSGTVALKLIEAAEKQIDAAAQQAVGSTALPLDTYA